MCYLYCSIDCYRHDLKDYLIGYFRNNIKNNNFKIVNIDKYSCKYYEIDFVKHKINISNDMYIGCSYCNLILKFEYKQDFKECLSKLYKELLLIDLTGIQFLFYDDLNNVDIYFRYNHYKDYKDFYVVKNCYTKKIKTIDLSKEFKPMKFNYKDRLKLLKYSVHHFKLIKFWFWFCRDNYNFHGVDNIKLSYKYHCKTFVNLVEFINISFIFIKNINKVIIKRTGYYKYEIFDISYFNNDIVYYEYEYKLCDILNIFKDKYTFINYCDDYEIKDDCIEIKQSTKTLTLKNDIIYKPSKIFKYLYIFDSLFENSDDLYNLLSRLVFKNEYIGNINVYADSELNLKLLIIIFEYVKYFHSFKFNCVSVLHLRKQFDKYYENQKVKILAWYKDKWHLKNDNVNDVIFEYPNNTKIYITKNKIDDESMIKFKFINNCHLKMRDTRRRYKQRFIKLNDKNFNFEKQLYNCLLRYNE